MRVYQFCAFVLFVLPSIRSFVHYMPIELEAIEPTQKEAIQIDLTMEKTGENSPEEDDDGSESRIEEKSTKQNQQMIEMSVALGNFDSNPVVSTLLANDDDDASNDNEISNGDQNSTGNAADEVDHVITLSSDVKEDKTGSKYSSSSNTANNDEHETDDEKVESPFLTEVSTKRYK
jgi:hypothetical protein